MAVTAPRRELAAYLGHGLNTVEGWLSPLSARVTAVLGRLQTTRGIKGAVGEIGVHHGRFFILLYLICSGDERAFAVDVFDAQSLNVDRSGRGDESLFLRNLIAHAGERDRLVLFARDSNTLSADEVRERTGPCRLISIDGGHTAATTENDLRLADALLVEGGITVLDDYFNPKWPGVSTGAARYFLAPDTRLKPFLIAPNKLFLCIGDASRYVAAVRKEFSWRITAEREMFGSTVIIVGHEAAKPVARLKQQLAMGPLGPVLTPAWRTLRKALRKT
jgi:hypothetical protein